jgi:hypothetical protein
MRWTLETLIGQEEELAHIYHYITIKFLVKIKEINPFIESVNPAPEIDIEKDLSGNLFPFRMMTEQEENLQLY